MRITVHMDSNTDKKRISELFAFFLKNKKKAFLFVIAFLVLALAYSIFGCPIKRFTGIPCFGCGMTRAWICVLTLRFKEAFSFHPLWPIPLIVLILFLKDQKNPFRQHKQIMNLFIILFIVTYIIRIIMHDPIVQWNLDEGLIYQILHIIKKWISGI